PSVLDLVGERLDVLDGSHVAPFDHRAAADHDDLAAGHGSARAPRLVVGPDEHASASAWRHPSVFEAEHVLGVDLTRARHQTPNLSAVSSRRRTWTPWSPSDLPMALSERPEALPCRITATCSIRAPVATSRPSTTSQPHGTVAPPM